MTGIYNNLMFILQRIWQVNKGGKITYVTSHMSQTVSLVLISWETILPRKVLSSLHAVLNYFLIAVTFNMVDFQHISFTWASSISFLLELSNFSYLLYAECWWACLEGFQLLCNWWGWLNSDWRSKNSSHYLRTCWKAKW